MGLENEADIATAEALYGQNTNPLTCVVAQEGIRAMAAALPKIMDDPLSQSARWDVSYGAWLCGSCLGLPPCLCITDYATPSAALLTCLTRKHTL